MIVLDAAAALVAAMVSVLAPQDAGPDGVLPRAFRPLMTFVDMTYPPEALAARVQGFVVLELLLDDQGRVTSTRVLAGSPPLAAPAAANARQWVFEPRAGRTVLVYRFDIDRALCNADSRSLFRLPSQTLATITACTGPGRPAVTPWPSDDLHVRDMPRLEYPPIAQAARLRGTVVVSLSIADNGTVASATSLAGVPLLTEAALKNAKEWRFAAIGPREAILVYEFAFTERLRSDPPCTVVTLNEIAYPGFIRIIASAPCLQVSNEAVVR